MEKFIPYPLIFAPIYKSLIWGGDLLPKTFPRQLPQTELPVGESWEISDRDDDQSVVKNGPYQGKTIHEMMSLFHDEILGQNHPSTRFPLLLKWIDAGDPLSLQVHPDIESCRILGHGAEPKTEIWYVVEHQPHAEIICGMKNQISQNTFLQKIQSDAIREDLHILPANKGDAFFIPSGLIHAIGGGNLLFEVQQNSNTTYRVSDWGRTDAKGNPRELHIDEACASVRSEMEYILNTNLNSDAKQRLLSPENPYFIAEEVKFTPTFTLPNIDKSIVVTAISGNIEITLENGDKYPVTHGESALLPAALQNVTLQSEKEETVLITTCL